MRVCYIDLEQAESRVVGAICLRLFGDPTYLDAVEAGDIHSYVAKMNRPDLPWPREFDLQWLYDNNLKKFPPEILKPAKRLASDMIIYRDKSLRFCMKPLGHGSNYLGQPKTMSQHSHLPESMIRDFQRVYFSPTEGFYAIKRWHEWVRETIQTKRQLTTMLGRRYIVLEDPRANTTWRKMVAYEPQSVGTGDYMNAGIEYLMQENYPLYLLKQVHDAVAFEYDRRDEDWLIPAACRALEWSFELKPHPDRYHTLATAPRLTRQEKTDLDRLNALLDNPRPFSIPTEAEVGWNLSHRKDRDSDGNPLPQPLNPNGLVPFREGIPDPRVYESIPPVTLAERIASGI